MMLSRGRCRFSLNVIRRSPLRPLPSAASCLCGTTARVPRFSGSATITRGPSTDESVREIDLVDVPTRTLPSPSSRSGRRNHCQATWVSGSAIVTVLCR